jgi:hypothetical protein
MNVIAFPRSPMALPIREAKLTIAEARLYQWTDSLARQPRTIWDDWYSLHELNAATGIPMTRLPTVLRRCGWHSQTQPGQGRLWHSPIEPADTSYD